MINNKVDDQYRRVSPVELLFGCPVCHPTAIFNLNLLTKEDIKYDSNFKNTEDFELWTRLVSQTNIGILAEILFGYRVHAQSITTTNNLNQRNTAVLALSKNLLNGKSNRIKKYLTVIYNNHQGSESKFQTLVAIIFIFFNLKRMNVKFTYYDYVIKSYRLMRKIIFSRDVNSLRRSR